MKKGVILQILRSILERGGVELEKIGFKKRTKKRRIEGGASKKHVVYVVSLENGKKSCSIKSLKKKILHSIFGNTTNPFLKFTEVN